MKVLFIARTSLHDNPGGDGIQIMRTAQYLRLRGLEVDIRLSGDNICYSGYDLIHFFNIIRPADILCHIARSGKPYLVSTIFVEYAGFDRQGRKGIARLASRILSSDGIEYAKAIARSLLNGEKIQSPSYLLLGQRRAIRRILRGAALLLPNSSSEYARLSHRYEIDPPYRVIPNAVDASLFGREGRTVQQPMADPGPEERSRQLLCVGRIEGIKNQLQLIRAVNGTGFRLSLIGEPAANQQAYYQQCRREAGSNICFLGRVPQEQLPDHYSSAAVHVLPSWFETTGLSSLEAAAMGCNIVVTDKGDTREYFGRHAAYCDPASPASILAAIRQAAAAPRPQQLRNRILSSWTWEETARLTHEAYRQVLEKT